MDIIKGKEKLVNDYGKYHCTGCFEGFGRTNLHILVPCWLPKPLSPRNQCSGWFAQTRIMRGLNFTATLGDYFLFGNTKSIRHLARFECF